MRFIPVLPDENDVSKWRKLTDAIL